MFVRVVECSDHDILYGILDIDGSVDIRELQQKIYEIKAKFESEGRTDWTVEDVIEELPQEWFYAFEQDTESVEI